MVQKCWRTTGELCDTRTLFAWLIAWTRHEAFTAICAPLCALFYGDEPVFLEAATDFARHLGLHADQV